MYSVIPDIGFNDIRFDMARMKVRAHFKNYSIRFEKNAPWSVIESDFYDEIGLRFTYGPDELLTSVGFLPECNISIVGIEIESANLKKVLKTFKRAGHTFVSNQDVYFLDSLGFCIYAQHKCIEAYEIYRGRYLENLEVEEQLAAAYYAEG